MRTKMKKTKISLNKSQKRITMKALKTMMMTTMTMTTTMKMGLEISITLWTSDLVNMNEGVL